MNKHNTDLRTILQALPKGRVLVVGDIMLDSYVEGDSDRISPEAPVPVVRIRSERHLIGGAGNVAVNIAALGAEVSLLGLCGEDNYGHELLNLVENYNIRQVLVKSSQRCTTVKTRILSRRQQMLRLDHEHDAPLFSEELKALLKALDQEMDNYDVIIFSDYAKGIFCSDFCLGFKDLLRKRTKLPIVLVDPKPKNFNFFVSSFLLTPNLKEAGEGASLPVDSELQILNAGRQIKQNLNIDNLLITLGADGMALFNKANEVWHIPTVAQAVFDVTGAGDTVIATTGLALASGANILEACIIANYAAGIVVSKVGAASVKLAELEEEIMNGHQPIISRWG